MMLDRRRFLSVAATGVAIGLTGARHVGQRADLGSDSDSHALAHAELLTALGPHAVREIGEAYRQLLPAESDPATLEARLRADLRAAHASNTDPVRADFAAGRVIVVRDWMLSHTEARQCALFSLHSA